MKKLNIILNIVMGANVGVFIGHGLYTVYDFKTHPDLYEIQSAPWYTNILMYGAVTVVVILVCLIIKAVLKHRIKNNIADTSTI